MSLFLFKILNNNSKSVRKIKRQIERGVLFNGNKKGLPLYNYASFLDIFWPIGELTESLQNVNIYHVDSGY